MPSDPPLAPDDLVEALLLSDAVKQADFPLAERAGDLLRRLADRDRHHLANHGRAALDALWPIFGGNGTLADRGLIRIGDRFIEEGIPALAREVARLDALCRAHGIDPEIAVDGPASPHSLDGSRVIVTRTDTPSRQRYRVAIESAGPAIEFGPREIVICDGEGPPGRRVVFG